MGTLPYNKHYQQIKIVKIFGICKLQCANIRYCVIEIRNICYYNYYLCNYKLFSFVKLVSNRNQEGIVLKRNSAALGVN